MSIWWNVLSKASGTRDSGKRVICSTCRKRRLSSTAVYAGSTQCATCNRKFGVKKNLNVDLKPWRTTSRDGFILICCQRDGGWSMEGMPVMNWLRDVMTKIRTYTDRRVKIRFHPGDKNTAKPRSQEKTH